MSRRLLKITIFIVTTISIICFPADAGGFPPYTEWEPNSTSSYAQWLQPLSYHWYSRDGVTSRFYDSSDEDWYFWYEDDYGMTCNIDFTNTDNGTIVIQLFSLDGTLLKTSYGDFTCDLPGPDFYFLGVAQTVNSPWNYSYSIENHSTSMWGMHDGPDPGDTYYGQLHYDARYFHCASDVDGHFPSERGSFWIYDTSDHLELVGEHPTMVYELVLWHDMGNFPAGYLDRITGSGGESIDLDLTGYTPNLYVIEVAVLGGAELGVYEYSLTHHEVGCPEDAPPNDQCNTNGIPHSPYYDQGCVDPDDDEDWYKFVCQYGLDEATIHIDVLSGDTDIYVYKDCDDYPSGYIASSTSSGDTDEVYIHDLPYTTYYIRLRHFGTSESVYDLSVEYTDNPPPPDCPSEPYDNDYCHNGYYLSDGSSLSGCVDDWDEFDWYEFSCPNGIDNFNVNFENTNIAYGDADLYIYGACADYPGNYIKKLTGTGADTDWSYYNPSFDHYYILVKLESGYYSEYSLDFAIECEPWAQCPTDYNDICEDADDIGTGGVSGMCLEDIFDEDDWYRFDCPPDVQTLIVTMTGEGGNADLWILEPPCDPYMTVLDISGNAGSNEQVSLTNPDPGYYYILPWVISGGPIEYSLDIDLVFNDPCDPDTSSPYTTTCSGWDDKDCGTTSITLYPSGIDNCTPPSLLDYEWKIREEQDTWPTVWDYSSDTSIEIDDLYSGTWYFMIRAVDQAGNRETDPYDGDFEIFCPSLGDLNCSGCVDLQSGGWPGDVQPLIQRWHDAYGDPGWDNVAAMADCAGRDDGYIDVNDIINVGIHWKDGC